MNSIYLLMLMGGFILGWASCNMAYGREGCTACLIGLVTGKRCADCESNKVPAKVKTP